MKAKIYVTRKIEDQVMDKLREVCEVRTWDRTDIPVSREVLEKEIENIDGLYCLLTDSIDRDLIEKATNLKVISNMAVGFNNIDIEAATEKKIIVTNTPGVLTETTADLTFALLMATARRVVEASQFLKEGKWKTWEPMLLTGQDIYGATLGIIGLGRIGDALVRRAKGFGMQVLYHNRRRKPEKEELLGVSYRELPDLLRESDYVCVMVPYSEETKNLIGVHELSLMKQTGILINTARGGIVDEEALYYALREGMIWGAGVDVFEQEPVPLNHPLLTLPNVVTLPHIGSASVQTRLRMMHLAADNLIQVIQGKNPRFIVNRQVIN